MSLQYCTYDIKASIYVAPDLLTCLLRNLCVSQEETVRTGYGTTDWFKIGKGYDKLYIVTLLI